MNPPSLARNAIQEIRTYSNALNSIAVDDEHLLIGSSDVRLLSADTGREIRRFGGRRGERVVSLGFTPDRRYAYVGAGGSLAMYRLDAPGHIIATCKRKTPDGWEHYNIEESSPEFCFAAAAATTIDNSVWLGTGMNGHGVGFRHQHLVQEWSWDSRSIRNSWGVAGELPHRETEDEDDDADVPTIHRAITAGNVSPSGDWIAVAAVVYEYWSVFNRLGQRNAFLYLLNTATGGSRRLKRSNFAYYDVSWSHDGTKLALAGTEPVCEVRDTQSWKLIQRFRGHEGEVRCCRFLPGDQRIVTAGSTDKTLRIWDVSTGEQVAGYQWNYGAFSAVAVSSEGCIYAGGDGPVAIRWDVRS